MKTKHPFVSKTTILGALTVITALAPELHNLIPDSYKPYAVAAVGVATVFLRFVTDRKLSFSATFN